MIRTDSGWDHRPVQSFYYVDSYRRLMPEDRRPGQKASLVQFWGKKLRRQWNTESGKFPPVFDEILVEDNLHTVDLNAFVVVMNLTDDGHPFDEDDL